MTFEQFFAALHGVAPFDWQSRLAERVCSGAGWPATLALPTGSGKTAAIDAAVYAMIEGNTPQPRRVFFVIDRRVVVDEAYERMLRICARLEEATGGILAEAAGKLRAMAGGDTPLAAVQLRGGVYKDPGWVRNPRQPLLIASTVDQTGSRLLFRGYGVSNRVWPIHAALTANDALIILDEAHCARPFSRTLACVANYREWVEKHLGLPFATTEMTATPRERNDALTLGEKDLANERLRSRLHAQKIVTGVVSTARRNDVQRLAADLTREARALASQSGIKRIAILCNRVKTAKAVYSALEGENRFLLIGRMRPIDRLQLPDPIARLKTGASSRDDDELVFVVATQTLEVGADLDFDAMVTECASIDALLQRFGRLDRGGELAARGLRAEGRLVVTAAGLDAKSDDAVYGAALRETWQWLAEGPWNFGIASSDGTTVRERLEREPADAAAKLRKTEPEAPLLTPSHLDSFGQTWPPPAADPDPAVFLHGRETGAADVQVIWRADLGDTEVEEWPEIVALCPPVGLEAMPVPLYEFRRWLDRGDPADGADIEGADTEDRQEEAGQRQVACLRWKGSQSKRAKIGGDVRPGDTLILRVEDGGWNKLGHLPDAALADAAELAREAMKRPGVFRLYPARLSGVDESLLTAEPDVEELRTVAREMLGAPEWIDRVKPEPYPAGSGWVFRQKRAMLDSEHDESSLGGEVSIEEHQASVARAASVTAALLPDTEQADVVAAAKDHDWGKADDRFQLAVRGDAILVHGTSTKLAKGNVKGSAGFRHELLSRQFAKNRGAAALVRHLIGSHHGRCRPFAPADSYPADVAYRDREITARELAAELPHSLNAGAAEDFWRLTRRYGWWGLAYLEATLRLADWKASGEGA